MKDDIVRIINKDVYESLNLYHTRLLTSLITRIQDIPRSTPFTFRLPKEWEKNADDGSTLQFDLLPQAGRSMDLSASTWVIVCGAQSNDESMRTMTDTYQDKLGPLDVSDDICDFIKIHRGAHVLSSSDVTIDMFKLLIQQIFLNPNHPGLSFYFTGHGARPRRGVMAGELCFADGRLSIELLKAILGTNNRFEMILLDSCYSATFAKACVDEDLAILALSASKESALDRRFTRYLMGEIVSFEYSETDPDTDTDTSTTTKKKQKKRRTKTQCPSLHFKKSFLD